MSNMLFYNSPVVIDKKTHKDVRVSLTGNYDFAAKTNSVPLLTIEFAEACKEYPIVFTTGPKDEISPISLLGLSQDKNAFVSKDGGWKGEYVPAYIRRYPFIPSLSTEDGSDLIVCIDKEYSGYDDPAGEPLFAEGGEAGGMLSSALKLLSDYHVKAAQTTLFCQCFQELDLFKAMNIDVKRQDGGTNRIAGLYTIDEEKLNNLQDKDFIKLFRAGHLPWAYMQLVSLSNIKKIT